MENKAGQDMDCPHRKFALQTMKRFSEDGTALYTLSFNKTISVLVEVEMMKKQEQDRIKRGRLANFIYLLENHKRELENDWCFSDETVDYSPKAKKQRREKQRREREERESSICYKLFGCFYTEYKLKPFRYRKESRPKENPPVKQLKQASTQTMPTK